MMRQRHEEILAEVTACRISQQGSQRTTHGIKNVFRMFRSFLAQWKIPMVRSRPALDERKGIWTGPKWLRCERPETTI